MTVKAKDKRDIAFAGAFGRSIAVADITKIGLAKRVNVA